MQLLRGRVHRLYVRFVNEIAGAEYLCALLSDDASAQTLVWLPVAGINS